MAAYSHSRTLFVGEKGRPIVFSIMPCEEKKRLRPLVEHGGGIITSSWREGNIRLAVEGTHVVEKDAIFSDFIRDSVNQNKLLNMRDYRISPGARQASASANSSDSELRPSSTIIHRKTGKAKGRQKYTLSEDMRIFSYIISEKVHSDVRGKRIWKNMQKIKLTDHSAESMRTHFLKFMIPRLDSYPIRDTWKEKFAYLQPADKSLPLPAPVTNGRAGNYSSSDVDIQDNEESDLELGNASGRNSPHRNGPGKSHAQSSSPQTRRTSSSPRAGRAHKAVYDFATDSDTGSVGKGRSHPLNQHPGRNERSDEEIDSGGSEDETSNNCDARASRARNNGNEDGSRRERRDDKGQRSKDSHHQERQRRPNGRNGLDDPQPGPSNKRPYFLPSNPARPNVGSPCKMRTRQHQEQDEENVSDFPVSDLHQPSTSMQHTGQGNNNATVASPRGSKTSNMGTAVETLCRDFDLSAKQAVQCLWVCSGSMEDAFHWLQHGKRRNGLEAWSKEEDQILRGADQSKITRLEEKFGAADVSKRLIFLGL